MKAAIRKIDTARGGLGKTLGASLALMLVLLLFGNGAEAQRSVIQVLQSPPSLSESQEHYLKVQTDEAAYRKHQIVQIDLEATQEALVTLNVFGTTHTLQRYHVDQRSFTKYSWFGRSTTDRNSSAVLVVNGDMVTGFFTLDMVRYMLYPLGDGLHAFIETDMSAFPADESERAYEDMLVPQDVEEPKDAGLDPYVGSGTGDAKSSANCSIRYLIAYTDDVDATLADVNSFIQGCVDDHNAVNDLSQGFHRVELARSVRVVYGETGDDIVDLDRFSDPFDGIMDNIHDLRALYDADVCQLIVDQLDDFCGRADEIGASFSTAFAVTARGCAIGNHTFAHETGHLYGMRHDTYADGTNTPFAYGHGFVNLGASSATRWRTVMGLNAECDDAGTSCSRLGRWSNPSLTVNGTFTGTFSTEDNARVAENEEATLSAFEATIANKAFFSTDVVFNEEEGHVEGSSSIVAPAAGLTLEYRSGSSGSARAPDIRLGNGFWARSGSDFVAFDGDCGDPQALGLVISDETADDHSGHSHGLSDEAVSPSANGALFENLEVFPNPFKESTTVRFSLTENGKSVTLTLRDILGREMMQIANASELSSGLHTIEVQTSQLPTGIYLLTLQAGDDVMVKRIVKGN
ncbi:MAG: T9SS type A sorting domain-containing protein [Cryomorphaceae bacterium]